MEKFTTAKPFPLDLLRERNEGELKILFILGTFGESDALEQDDVEALTGLNGHVVTKSIIDLWADNWKIPDWLWNLYLPATYVRPGLDRKLTKE